MSRPRILQFNFNTGFSTGASRNSAKCTEHLKALWEFMYLSAAQPEITMQEYRVYYAHWSDTNHDIISDN